MNYLNIPSYTRHWRTLYQHKQQWYRHILGTIMNYHFGTLLPHFLFVWVTTASFLDPSPLPLHLVAILLSLTARLSWTFLFRDPAQFAGLRRPGLYYKWTVLAVCGTTTVPNLCVHAVVLRRSFRGLEEEGARLIAAKLGVLFSVLQIGLLWGACALCVWMVWRFLVDWEHEMYDPCVKSELGGRGIGRAVEESEPALEPYSDTPYSSVCSEQGAGTIGFLLAAYTKQRIEASAAAQERGRNHQRDNPCGSIIEHEHEGTPEYQNISISGTPISAEDRSLTPLRCPTVARYEYMDRNHTGAHSWLSYPLIPTFIFAYSSLLSIPIGMFVNEVHYSKNPSPNTKKGLFYILLGSYLLCFYALKHRLRRSLFEKLELPLPEPWIQVSPLSRGRNQFKRTYAGPLTTFDPRLRAIPPAAVYDPAAIRTKEYMQTYNAHPSSCAQYWGHQGRQWRSTPQIKPTVLRVGFIVLATFLYLNGRWYISSYHSGVDDRRSWGRFMHWKMILSMFMVPHTIFIVMYVIGSAGSMLLLWFKCSLRYEETLKSSQRGMF